MRRHLLRACSLGLSISLAAGIVVHAALASGCGGSTTSAVSPGPSATPAGSYPSPPPYFYATKAPSPAFYPQQAQAPGR